MPGRSVRIHPAALEEAEAAAEWYGIRSRGAAEAFLYELDRTIDLISRHPEQYQSHEFGTRRAVLHKFPYLIVWSRRYRGHRRCTWAAEARVLA